MLINQYDNFITDNQLIESSQMISKGPGFFEENSIYAEKSPGLVMQTPEQSVFSDNNGNFGFGGGFGNVDFFMSGTLDSKKYEEDQDQEKLSIAETGNKDMFEIQESHYHVKPYKVEKFTSNKSNKTDDEDLKDIEYAESRIVPREEISKPHPKFSYLSNAKKQLKEPSTLFSSPITSELKLLNLINEKESFSIKEKACKIGLDPKENTQVLASKDISRCHAEILYKEGKYYLKDLKSKSGSWLRVTQDRFFKISHNFFFRIGSKDFFLNIADLAKTGFIELLWENGGQSRRIQAKNPGFSFTIGKQKDCDLSCEDAYMSKIHCRICEENGEIRLEDCKSSNGTWVKIEPDEPLLLKDAEEFRLGNNQRFKVLSIYVHSKEDQRRKCLHCNVEDVNTVIEPCRHVVLCKNCAKSQRICPECNTAIYKIIHTS